MCCIALNSERRNSIKCSRSLLFERILKLFHAISQRCKTIYVSMCQIISLMSKILFWLITSGFV